MLTPLSTISTTRDYGLLLQPLLDQLSEYDRLRLQLEEKGGDISDLQDICKVLTQPISFVSEEAALADFELLHDGVRLLCGFDVMLDVRQLPTDMPVYYLCRVHRDFFCDYSLIVEDLYQSPGYPLLDNRFARFMTHGHEAHYLRLSPFRKRLSNLLNDGSRECDRKIDALLYKLGRYVYQAAWHEDQIPAMLCATHFGLRNFKQAIELLYVCLSAELCELRAAVDEDLLRAFRCVEEQHVLGKFLKKLPALEGSALSDIPKSALKRYCRLNHAFSRFLNTQVRWGSRKEAAPLYKLIFSNFSRLDLVRAALQRSQDLKTATASLESEANSMIEETLK